MINLYNLRLKVYRKVQDKEKFLKSVRNPGEWVEVEGKKIKGPMPTIKK